MKIVVGILRDNADQIQKYVDQGYHVEHLDEHARGFGETLMKIKLTDDEVQKVRQRGYKVTSRYWINIALLSAKDKDKIVIADLQEEDYKKVFSKIV
jgi:hypothetical protein